jgi:hypothetical protein
MLRRALCACSKPFQIRSNVLALYAQMRYSLYRTGVSNGSLKRRCPTCVLASLEIAGKGGKRREVISQISSRSLSIQTSVNNKTGRLICETPRLFI